MSVIPFGLPRLLQSGSPARKLQDGSLTRVAAYADFRDFYAGRHFPTSAGRTRATPTVFNYARAIVDKHVAYLFSRGIQFLGPQPGDGEDVAMAAIARKTSLALVLMQAGTNASVCGDAVLKVLWDPARKRVRVVNIDPARFFPTYRGDDADELLSVSVCSTISQLEAASRYGRTTSHASEELTETWTQLALTIDIGKDRVLDAINPYGFIPYVHVPNLGPPNTPWGISDLTDLMDINREYDRTVSNQSDSIRYHSDPPVIFKGVRDHSDLAVGPGTVWDIPEGGSVSLLEWTGQMPAIDAHLDRVVRALYDVSESPRSSFGDTAQAFSGIALETQLQPIVQRTLRRRTAWTPKLELLAAMALQLLDQFTGAAPRDSYDLRVHWLPMLPRDDDAEANRQIALNAAGLSSHTTSMEALGTEDPEAELAKVAEQRSLLGVTKNATPQEAGTKLIAP